MPKVEWWTFSKGFAGNAFLTAFISAARQQSSECLLLDYQNFIVTHCITSNDYRYEFFQDQILVHITLLWYFQNTILSVASNHNSCQISNIQSAVLITIKAS